MAAAGPELQHCTLLPVRSKMSSALPSQRMILAAARRARRRGPEAGALRMALWLAFFNQAFASTAIINCERAAQALRLR